MQPHEKLADRVQPDPALQPERIERCQDQTRQPLPAFGRFPPPRLRVGVAALHRLGETMHTAFRQPGLAGHLSHTLRAMVTKTLENPDAFGPKCHVGQCSEG
jgi:hypothetical protein